MKKELLFACFCSLFLFYFSIDSNAFGHPHQGEILIDNHSHDPITEYIPLTGVIGLEKTTLEFHAPKDNDLPWGFVEGKIANHVSGYPVIVQFFQGGEAKHFAQTDVLDDGTYEYKFRVFSIDDGDKIRIFDGNYKVVIFKVVYLQSQV